MGAASADFFYASVAAFGLGYVINTVQTTSYCYKLSVEFFLLCIGLKIYFDNPIRQIRQRRQGRVSKTGLLGDYLSLFFLTVSNPITVVVFMAVLPECPFSGIFFHAGELLVVIGVLLGGGVWWYTLSTLVNIFRKKFRLRVLITINRVSGLVITILGALVILAAFAPFKNLVIH